MDRFESDLVDESTSLFVDDDKEDLFESDVVGMSIIWLFQIVAINNRQYSDGGSGARDDVDG